MPLSWIKEEDGVEIGSGKDQMYIMKPTTFTITRILLPDEGEAPGEVEFTGTPEECEAWAEEFYETGVEPKKGK